MKSASDTAQEPGDVASSLLYGRSRNPPPQGAAAPCLPLQNADIVELLEDLPGPLPAGSRGVVTAVNPNGTLMLDFHAGSYRQVADPKFLRPVVARSSVKLLRY